MKLEGKISNNFVKSFFLNNKIDNFERFCFLLENKFPGRGANAKFKGDIFEVFSIFFFNSEKKYYDVKNVLLTDQVTSEIKKELNIGDKGSGEAGVDGLITTTNNTFRSFQSKFYTHKPPLNVWTNAVNESKRCELLYIVTNFYEDQISKHIRKWKDEVIIIDRKRFNELDEIFYQNIVKFYKNEKIKEQTKYEREPHQIEIIKNLRHHLNNSSRGKFISACGTGKTITSLWLVEDQKYRNVLFLVPNRQLVRQTYKEWKSQCSIDFDYLCVFSDQDSQEEKKKFYDYDIDETLNFDIPVTTNINKISKWLKKQINKPKYIFSTYHSIDKVKKAIKKINFKFDIIIFDEAHRTVGLESNFSLGIYDKNIKSKKRLFMTATEKILTPRITQKAELNNKEVFSMDKEEYGQLFKRYSFHQAIKDNVICDYNIIISSLPKEIIEKIHQDPLVKFEKNKKKKELKFNTLYHQLLLNRAFEKHELNKAFVFHGRREKSINFSKDLKEYIKGKDFFAAHIDFESKFSDRYEKFQKFKNKKKSVISNVRILNEGVDAPEVDSVFICDPKKSLVDIIQCTGRALRNPGRFVKGSPKKTAKIIIPLIIEYDSSEDDVKNNFRNPDYLYIFNIIQSLRDQDNRLEEWIDNLALNKIKGPKPPGPLPPGPIIIDVPEKINFEKIKNALHTVIIEKNSNVHGFNISSLIKGKKRFKSGEDRTFMTISDYNIDKYLKKMCIKTVEKFNSNSQKLSTKQIKYNNNNVSHSRRMGLIYKNENEDSYQLSSDGIKLKNNQIDFYELTKKILLSKSDIVFYPYKIVLNFLKIHKKFNFIQFLYGFSIMKGNSEADIKNLHYRINKLKKDDYDVLRSASQKVILESLNNYNKDFRCDLKLVDIMAKSTKKNLFNYLANHLNFLNNKIKKEGFWIKLED